MNVASKSTSGLNICNIVIINNGNVEEYIVKAHNAEYFIIIFIKSDISDAIITIIK